MILVMTGGLVGGLGFPWCETPRRLVSSGLPREIAPSSEDVPVLCTVRLSRFKSPENYVLAPGTPHQLRSDDQIFHARYCTAAALSISTPVH